MLFNRDIKYYILGKALVFFVLFGCSNKKILFDGTIEIENNNYVIISKANISWFNSPTTNRNSGFEVNIVCQKQKSLVVDSLYVNGIYFPLKMYIKNNAYIPEYDDSDQVIINSFLNFPKGENIKTGILFFHNDSLRFTQNIVFVKSENIHVPQ